MGLPELCPATVWGHPMVSVPQSSQKLVLNLKMQVMQGSSQGETPAGAGQRNLSFPGTKCPGCPEPPC